jgi:hypothetical protein
MHAAAATKVGGSEATLHRWLHLPSLPAQHELMLAWRNGHANHPAQATPVPIRQCEDCKLPLPNCTPDGSGPAFARCPAYGGTDISDKNMGRPHDLYEPLAPPARRSGEGHDSNCRDVIGSGEGGAVRTKRAKTLPKTLPGVVCAQWVRCGRRQCRCATGQLHGPYHYRFWRQGGRLRKEYVRPADLAHVRAACAARRQEWLAIRAAWDQWRQFLARLREVERL